MRKTKKHFRKISLIMILSVVLGLGVFVFFSQAQAATYYVAPNGTGSVCTDTNPCNVATGQTKANAGDTVKFTPGSYKQRIKVIKSGSPGNPIIYEGTLGPNGERLSIFDLSEPVTGWVLAPEVDSLGRVWKKSFGYRPSAISIIDTESGESHSVFRLCNNGDILYNIVCHAYTNENNINELLKGANERIPGQCPYSKDDPECQNAGDEYKIYYWDGIEAQFISDAIAGGASNAVRDNFDEYAASAPLSTTYIRFRNGDNPNNFKMTVTPPDSGHYSSEAVIYGYGVSYIEIKNFIIKASTHGIAFSSMGDGTRPQYITIDNNKIYNGKEKIRISGDSFTFSNNELTQKTYAEYKTGNVFFGAHDCDNRPESFTCNNISGIREHLYDYDKYKADGGSTGRSMGGLTFLGNGIKAYGNYIYNLVDAIGAFGNNFQIYNNSVYNMSSVGIYLQGEQSINSHIYDNLFNNVNIVFRAGDQNEGGGPLYIYKNKCQQPENFGRHIYPHVQSPSGTYIIPEIYYYHNSFSGGADLNRLSDWMRDWNGGNLAYSKTYFINNIVSSPIVEKNWMINYPWGACNHNWIYGSNWPNTCASDITNIAGSGYMWDPSKNHNFTPPNGSNAIDSGINLLQNYLINEQPLPGITAEYYEDGKPDMGAVQVVTQNHADINSDGAVNIIDIQLCVNVILGKETDPDIVERAKRITDPIIICDALDLQAIVNEMLAL